MSKNRVISKKVAAGAMLIALSGFVPKVTKPAHAATATITASGTFSSGIKMTAGNNLQFGVIVATGPTGKVSINTAGATSTSKAFFNGGTQKQGSIAFQAGASKNIDITVTGMKNTLTLGTFGGAKTGTVNLPTVSVGGPYAAAEVFKVATTKNTATLTSTTADLQIGGVITWGATLPIGTFATPLTVTVTF